MDEFVIDARVAAAINEVKGHHVHRHNRTDDDKFIKLLTDNAKLIGATAAAGRYNATNKRKETSVSAKTVGKYLRYFEKHNAYFNPKKRGRRSLVDDAKLNKLFLDAMKRVSQHSDNDEEGR